VKEQDLDQELENMMKIKIMDEDNTNYLGLIKDAIRYRAVIRNIDVL
jgi:hypothetical protein